MKFNYLFLVIIIFSSSFLFSQKKFQVKGFGHLGYDVEYHEDDDEVDLDYVLGEQSLFISGSLAKKFSYLGEFALNYDHHTNSVRASIRRARVKYNYFGNHSVIIGQMHTPINYWNDVYFHARIFYPTADRPLSFSYFMPIHSLGIRAQGQNIGKLNFGYDIQSSSGHGIDGTNPSFTSAMHIKPVDGMRIGASYYYSHLKDVNALHHQHSEQQNAASNYEGTLDYQLLSFSFARFEKSLEILNEFSTAITTTDSLGTAYNYSNYLYIGYNIKEKHTPFVLLDLLQSAENDLFIGPFNQLKFGIGYKHEFSPALNLKFQLERYTAIQNMSNSSNQAPNGYEFSIQLSYAIY